MKIVVIDDEERARKGIIEMVRLFCPSGKVVGEADSVKSAIGIIKSSGPDLVLLDIEMKDGTGFDLLSALKPFNFRVIFITAHEEFAIRAFKFSALDYLVKPVDPDELSDAISRAKESMLHQNSLERVETLLSNLTEQSKQNKKLVLKTNDKISVVSLNEILRCESDRNYTSFFLTGNRRIVVSHTLKEYEEILGENDFFRVHQSHLVNLDHITGFEKRDGGFVVLNDGSLVPVSSRKKDHLLRLLDRL